MKPIVDSIRINVKRLFAALIGIASPRRMACALPLMLSLSWGCAPPSAGTGSVGVDSTTDGRLAVYGTGSGGLAFVIFTDRKQGSRSVSKSKSGLFGGGTCWEGRIESDTEPELKYSATGAGISIGKKKREFDLSKGRVFLAAADGKETAARQLDIAINSVDRRNADAIHGEIKRLAAAKQVAAFLAGNRFTDAYVVVEPKLGRVRLPNATNGTFKSSLKAENGDFFKVSGVTVKGKGHDREYSFTVMHSIAGKEEGISQSVKLSELPMKWEEVGDWTVWVKRGDQLEE